MGCKLTRINSYMFIDLCKMSDVCLSLIGNYTKSIYHINLPPFKMDQV